MCRNARSSPGRPHQFDRDIVCTADKNESGSHVNFLDLKFRLQQGQLQYETYRKPMCSYMYTPADSCHSSAVFSGVASTEFFRLMLTNGSEASFMFHSEFFVGKLLRCGYDLNSIRSIQSKFAWPNKHSILARVGKTDVSRNVIPFKIAYTADASLLYISRTLQKHKYILGSHLFDARFLTAFRTSPNIFRSRFKDKYV